MTWSIKRVTKNIYHILLNDSISCMQCSSGLADYLQENKLFKNSQLILDTGNRRCLTHCYDNFLTSVGDFKSIAYIVANETMVHNPWTHAFAVSNSTDNTHYFGNYDDALNWCVTEESNIS